MPERTSEVKELLHWMEMYMGQAHEKFKALDSSRPRQIGSLNRLKARLIFLTGGYETFVDILDTLKEMHETLRLLAPPAPECQEVAAQGHRVSVRPQNDSVGGAAGTVPGTHRELALGAYDGTDTVGFQSLQSQVGDVHPSTEEPDLAEDLTLTFAYLYSLTTETVDILASMTGSGPLSKAGARMHLWAANSVEVKPSIEQICGVKYLHESDLGQCLLTVLATALALGERMLRREKQAAQTQSVATSLYQELLLALGAPQLARRTKQWRREVAVFDIADPVADSILLNRRRQEDCRSLTRAVECFFKLSPMLRAQRQMFHATYRERMHASAISNLVSEEKLEDILDSVEEHDGAVENGDGHKALLLPQVESQVDELRLLALPPSKGESVLKESDRERTVRETRLYASVLAEFNPKQLARGVASPTQTRDVKTALHGTVSTSSDQKGSALEDTANADKFRNLPRHDHYDVNL